MNCSIVAYGATDRGRVRSNNQDHFLNAELVKSIAVQQTSLDDAARRRHIGLQKGTLLLVADGVGGASAGGEASELALDTICHQILDAIPWFVAMNPDTEQELVEALTTLFSQSEQRILEAAKEEPGAAGMATTMTLAFIVWPRCYVAHAGDSRCYLVRDGEMRQLTHDDTYAQSLVDSGVLEADAASSSPWGNVLVNVLGGDSADPVQPRLVKIELLADDRLLLCSDGLTKHNSDAEIQQSLTGSSEPKEMAKALLARTLERGATDNVTVVIARAVEEPASESR